MMTGIIIFKIFDISTFIMATIRSMDMFDLLKFNNVNLDLLTETFYTNFYGKYLNKWGEYCVVSEDTVSTI